MLQTSTTRQTLVRALENLEYTSIELLLNPLQFGIPNSRLRYYLLARPGSKPFVRIPPSSDPQRVWRHIPGHGEDWKDPRLQPHEDSNIVAETSDCISEFLDILTDEESQGYRIPDHVLEKWGRNFDIVLPSSRRTCCFTRGTVLPSSDHHCFEGFRLFVYCPGYTNMVGRTGSILQLNEGLDVGQF